MICPRCSREFTDCPSLSRRDNKTKICSPCGTDEAFFDYFLRLKYSDNPILMESFKKKERSG